jgi:hypothetical protein
MRSLLSDWSPTAWRSTGGQLGHRHAGQELFDLLAGAALALDDMICDL